MRPFRGFPIKHPRKTNGVLSYPFPLCQDIVPSIPAALHRISNIGKHGAAALFVDRNPIRSKCSNPDKK